MLRILLYLAGLILTLGTIGLIGGVIITVLNRFREVQLNTVLIYGFAIVIAGWFCWTVGMMLTN